MTRLLHYMGGSQTTALNPVRRGILLLAVFVALWAVVEGLFGARLQQHYNLMQVVWSRYAAHLLCLFATGFRSGPAVFVRTRRPGFQLARSMLMLVMPLSFALSLSVHDRPATVWSVFWLSPLFVLMGARLWLGERASGWLWVLAIAGGIVAALMESAGPPSSVAGLLLPLSMSVSFSLYVVMTRSLRDEPPKSNLFFTACGVFAVLTPMMPFVWVTPTLHDAVLLFLIGSGGLVALWALDRACAAVEVSRVAPVMHLHLVCLVLVSVIFDGTAPSLRQVSGALWICLVVLAIWMWSPLGSNTDGVASRHA